MRSLVWGLVVAACSHSPPTTPASAPSRYPVCMGQGDAPPATTPRTGAMSLQLAPAFLDAMPACAAESVAIPASLADPTPGTVNAKGDCAFPNGVVCHYHHGVEFVDKGLATRPSELELHCIFPGTEAKSPTVFGGHFRCELGASEEVHDGAACGEGLLPGLQKAMASCDARCCDDGTLTNPTEVRTSAGTLDVRPDFRICRHDLEVDNSKKVAEYLRDKYTNQQLYGWMLGQPESGSDVAQVVVHGSDGPRH